jgi:ABC-type molybdate transport system substrate-binding protein
MNARIAILAIFFIAIGAILYVTLNKEAPAAPEAQATPASAKQTKISMLYSTEKEDWIKASAVSFAKTHPEIQLDLKGMGSLKAAQAILDGVEKPTVFSPADSLVMNLLASDLDTKTHQPAFVSEPKPLLITPLVFVAWADRAEILKAAGGGTISWKGIEKAVASNQGWPAIGGKAEWGFVKLGHTDPTQSNSGIQALFLMSLEYYNKNSLSTADVLEPKYQEWITGIEKGVTRFEASTGTFMTDMVRFGPSKYDISVVYEALAISQIENAQGRWGVLNIYYPATTVWSDNPVAILNGVEEAEKKAAELWVDHLLSRESQQSALSFGFRPGDPSVPIQSSEASNPFTRYAQYGVQIQIPPVAVMPEGPVVRNLITMWSRVVPRTP